ncbi:class F sortase [Streptomyces sp. NPDC054847]
MDDAPTTRTTEATRLPSYKLLFCAAITGVVLVGGALHEDRPPQPGPAQQRAPAARPAPERAPQSPAAGPAPERAPQPPAARPAPERAPQPPAVGPLAPADPVRLLIPAIGVNAPLTRLELNEKGALQPPPAAAPTLAGWYGDGATPGENGTAVTAGHVDTPAGRGVFYRLGALGKGDTIDVVRKDRRTAVFTVDAVEVHDKNDFPDEKVYGDSGRPELRVITCGGDRSSKGGYEGNVVVYATLSAVK